MAQLLPFEREPGCGRSPCPMNREIDVRHVLPAIRVPTLITTHQSEVARSHGRTRPGGQTRRAAWRQESCHRGDRGHDRVGDRALPDRGAGSPAVGKRLNLTACWRQSCSPTSSARRERAASLGDRAWRELLERHHVLVRRQLLRFRGQEVDTAGDGFFASFDGPARAIRCACAIVESTSGARSRVTCRPAHGRVRTRRRQGYGHRRAHRAHGSPPTRSPARCSSPAPSRISSPARARPSTTAAYTNSRASPASGASMPSSADGDQGGSSATLSPFGSTGDRPASLGTALPERRLVAPRCKRCEQPLAA